MTKRYIVGSFYSHNATVSYVIKRNPNDREFSFSPSYYDSDDTGRNKAYKFSSMRELLFAFVKLTKRHPLMTFDSIRIYEQIIEPGYIPTFEWVEL